MNKQQKRSFSLTGSSPVSGGRSFQLSEDTFAAIKDQLIERQSSLSLATTGACKRIIIRSPNTQNDLAMYRELITSLTNNGLINCFEIIQTESVVLTSLLCQENQVKFLSSIVRGIGQSYDVEIADFTCLRKAKLTLSCQLLRPKNLDHLPIRPLPSFGAMDPVASLLEANLPMGEREGFRLSLKVGRIAPERQEKALQELLIPLPALNPFDPVEAFMRLIWPPPKGDRFGKEPTAYLRERLSDAVELQAVLSLSGDDPARLWGKAATLDHVLSSLDIGEGYLVPDGWQFAPVDHGVDQEIDHDKSAVVGIDELINLWHPIPASVRVPGVQAASESIYLPPQIKRVKGPVLGTCYDRGEKITIRLPEETFNYGVIPITGPSGYGKSVLAESILYQVLAHNRAAAVVIDPHGSFNNHFCLRSIPQGGGHTGREQDIYLFELGNSEHPVTLPLSRSDGVSPQQFRKHIEPVIRSILSDTLSASFARMDEAIASLTTAVAYLPDANLWHIYQLLTDTAFTKHTIPLVTDPITKQWLVRFSSLSDTARDQIAAPIISRLSKLWRNSSVANMVLQKAGKDPFALIDQGAILLFSLSGEDILQEASFLYELMLSKVKMQLAKRLGTSNTKRVFLILDESQLATGITLPSLIKEYRKVGLSPIIITQGMSAWNKNPLLYQTILDNYSSFISFAPRDESNVISQIFDPLTAKQLANLNKHQAALKISVNQQTLPAFMIETINIERDADELALQRIKDKSRKLFTRPKAEVESYIYQLVTGTGEPRSEGEQPRPKRPKNERYE